MHLNKFARNFMLSRVLSIYGARGKFAFFFSFSASFKNSSSREKVGKLSLFWDWWAVSLFVSIIVAKYNIFPALTMAARAKKKI